MQIAWSAHELERVFYDIFGTEEQSPMRAPYPVVSA
jgi:hypothetical protein